MITCVLVGEREIIARLDAMPGNLRQILLRRMWNLVQRVKARVQKKLSGEVLNVVTGALRRSIQADAKEEAATILGRVFSTGDVKYARIHELGGTTRAHIIEPRKAAILSFMMGGDRVFARRVHHPGSKIPERSYLRSTAREMRDEIVRSLSDGILEASMTGRGE